MRTDRSKKVVLAMSGGVDSSVSAWLLKQQGYSVLGVTYRLHDLADKAVADASAVCRQLGIPHVVLDLRKRFERDVLEPFTAGYLQGRTPNPCVVCNPVLKFQVLLEQAERWSADHIAMGHYARVVRHPETQLPAIARSPAGQKDQSYFLYRLTRAQLERLIFPVSGLMKDEVRQLAREAGLFVSGSFPVAETPDSQDICFIDTDYAHFLNEYAATHPKWQQPFARLSEPGVVIGTDGQEIGRHQGLLHYTPGQRKGFETRSIDRLYVVGRDASANTLVVGDRDKVATDTFTIEDVVFSGLDSVNPDRRLDCRIRNTATATPGRVNRMPDGRYRVTLERKVHAPAPGQSAVFYDGDIIAFGGVISDMT